MRDIHCSQCGKFLFSTDKSDGAAAAEAPDHGVISKMPFLYGIPGVFFFCNKDCGKQWFKEHVSEQEKKAFHDAVENISDKHLAEMSVEYSIH